MGYLVQVDRLLPIGVGLLFAFLGNYLTRIEPNWFIGIRTPWTLSSDAVWRKTHRSTLPVWGARSARCCGSSSAVSSTARPWFATTAP